MRMIVIALALPLAACGMSFGSDNKPGIPGTGSGDTRSYAATDFTAVELAGSDDVDVHVGTPFSIRAEGPSDQLDTLRIDRQGDTLRIDRRNKSGISWGSHHDKVKIYVTVPRLAGATVAGSGDLTVDRVDGGMFTGTLAGSGNLDLAALNVDSAKFEVAGSGHMRVAGRAKSLGIDIAGSGDIDGSRLKAASATVSIAGSGGVRAVVDGPAKVSIMGSGDVDLGPGARCQTSKMGSGSVRCGG